MPVAGVKDSGDVFKLTSDFRRLSCRDFLGVAGCEGCGSWRDKMSRDVGGAGDQRLPIKTFGGEGIYQHLERLPWVGFSGCPSSGQHDTIIANRPYNCRKPGGIAIGLLKQLDCRDFGEFPGRGCADGGNGVTGASRQHSPQARLLCLAAQPRHLGGRQVTSREHCIRVRDQLDHLTCAHFG